MTQTQKTRRLVSIASLLLLALVCIVGVVVWNDTRRGAPVPQALNDLHSIRIQRPDFPDTVLQTDTDGNWRITAPCALPVNERRLQPLLDALTPAPMSYAAVDVDLEAAGLVPPEAVIIMNEQALGLGITDLSGERRYLQRGERVEFVPEWVLSLVDGGLSALASLDVFPQTLEELVLQTDSDAEPIAFSVPDDELAVWQTLAAQQIVAWPLQDAGPQSASHALMARTTSQQERLLNLHIYPRYAAFHYQNAACAYLLPTASLPDLSLP